jgi:WG containing repeat
MMSTKTCTAAIVLVCLGMVVAYPQPARRKRQPVSRHLYQVSRREKITGEKKIGFIDNTGKLVIGFERLPKTTIAVGDFHEGRARIYLRKIVDEETHGNMNATVGFIDEMGRVIVEPRFETARDFSEGLAYVEAKDFKGFIDRSGKVVIRVAYRFAKDFHEGLAAVGMNDRQPKNDWGYIDRSGKLVIKQQYSFADDFSEGLAGVEVDGKYGFIDKRGVMIIPPRFDLRREERHTSRTLSSGRFVEGLACVRFGNFVGYINHKGEFVIRPQFSYAQDFSEGLAWATTKGRSNSEILAGWIDKSGRWAVTEVDGYSFSGSPQVVVYASEYQDWRYSEGLIPFFKYVERKGRYGYMDRRGRVVIQPREYERVGRFTGGVAAVVFNGNSFVEDYGYINRAGRLIWRSK